MKKSKVKPKVKPKKVKKKVKKVGKVKKPVRITDRGIPVTKLGNFDDDSDWRLKSVHQIINQLKKQIYDLSINVEGEHDHICKTIQRCHNRIEHVEGLILQQSLDIASMVETINKYVERLDALPRHKNDVEERIREAFKDTFDGINRDSDEDLR
mgnify:CR=1 FL=1|tara:strand:- start:63 stop:524 length:462 start_codon:yes stop_codon:yes gene_type:complete